MNEIHKTPSTKLSSLDGLSEVETTENERKITPETRYKYSTLIAPDGNKYFSKKLAGFDAKRDEKWSKYLAREAMWADFATAAGRQNPDLHFTGLSPVYVESREGGGIQRVVYPYIDAKFVAEPGEGDSLHDLAVLSRYAQTLVTLDAFGANWQPEQPVDMSDEHTPYNHVNKAWDEWLSMAPLYEEGYLTPGMIAQAKQIVDDYSKHISPRFQHGDFVPWHLFSVEQEGQEPLWISFDGEHAGTLKPRLYDLAYSYSRLFTRARDSVTASRLLGEFIARSNNGSVDEFYEAFLPVLMTRSIGMFLDAYNDGQRGVDYLSEAKDLYERCVSQDPQALLRA